MTVIRNIFSQKYIATRNLRKKDILWVIAIEEAQKFPSLERAKEFIQTQGINNTEVNCIPYYYPEK